MPAPADRPDVVRLLTDQERAPPPYEPPAVRAWRARQLHAERWFAEHAVRFERHYTGSLACVPSRPTLLAVAVRAAASVGGVVGVAGRRARSGAATAGVIGG